jgi:dUTP pyrophosphatase
MQDVANVKVQLLHKNAKVPQKAHSTDAGYDLYYCPEDGKTEVRLDQGRRALISCGFAMELPAGYEAQVRTRSGLALEGLIVLNSPGTIDSGYRGQVKVIMININASQHTIRPGDRIAQMVIQKLPIAELSVVGSLGGSDRGEGGFGSSGVSEGEGR